jgi:hydrogenase-4 component B
MRGSMLLLAGTCVAIGLMPVVFWPALSRVAAAWHPVWTGAAAPAPLQTLGRVQLTVALLAVMAASWLWRRAQRHGFTSALSWDCGYAIPTARMQYTAGSFAGIITEWFAFILRPERHDHRPDATFPAHATFTEHTPETVLEYVVEPAGGLILRVANAVRRLQHGRVQSYLLYLLVGLGSLGLLVWAGTAP